MPILAGGITAVLLVAVVFGGAFASIGSHTIPNLCTTSTTTASDIPATYLALYQQAGAQYGLPWPVLAAIGKVESDHGRSQEPGVTSGANYAGAMGPMQFLASTWAQYGQGGNVYKPEDAIPAAARLLNANGAPGDLKKAIFAYNHADWYVTKVLAQATTYAGGQGQTTSPEAAGNCDGGILPPSQAAATVITFARAQLGKPYVWGAAGPDAYDCSGLTMAAYAQISVHLPHNAAAQWSTLTHVSADQAQPGDLVFFITDGSPSAPGHVGIYLGGGQMIEAPNHTAPVRISTVNRPDLVGYGHAPALGTSGG